MNKNFSSSEQESIRRIIETLSSHDKNKIRLPIKNPPDKPIVFIDFETSGVEAMHVFGSSVPTEISMEVFFTDGARHEKLSVSTGGASEENKNRLNLKVKPSLETIPSPGAVVASGRSGLVDGLDIGDETPVLSEMKVVQNLSEFLSQVGTFYLGGYNSKAFDSSVLSELFGRHGKRDLVKDLCAGHVDVFRILQSKIISGEIPDVFPDLSLGAVCDALSIDPPEHVSAGDFHTASFDVGMTYSLWLALGAEVSESKSGSLEELLKSKNLSPHPPSVQNNTTATTTSGGESTKKNASFKEPGASGKQKAGVTGAGEAGAAGNKNQKTIAVAAANNQEVDSGIYWSKIRVAKVNLKNDQGSRVIEDQFVVIPALTGQDLTHFEVEDSYRSQGALCYLFKLGASPQEAIAELRSRYSKQKGSRLSLNKSYVKDNFRPYTPFSGVMNIIEVEKDFISPGSEEMAALKAGLAALYTEDSQELSRNRIEKAHRYRKEAEAAGLNFEETLLAPESDSDLDAKSYESRVSLLAKKFLEMGSFEERVKLIADIANKGGEQTTDRFGGSLKGVPFSFSLWRRICIHLLRNESVEGLEKERDILVSLHYSQPSQSRIVYTAREDGSEFEKMLASTPVSQIIIVIGSLEMDYRISLVDGNLLSKKCSYSFKSKDQTEVLSELLNDLGAFLPKDTISSFIEKQFKNGLREAGKNETGGRTYESLLAEYKKAAAEIESVIIDKTNKEDKKALSVKLALIKHMITCLGKSREDFQASVCEKGVLLWRTKENNSIFFGQNGFKNIQIPQGNLPALTHLKHFSRMVCLFKESNGEVIPLPVSSLKKFLSGDFSFEEAREASQASEARAVVLNRFKSLMGRELDQEWVAEIKREYGNVYAPPEDIEALIHNGEKKSSWKKQEPGGNPPEGLLNVASAVMQYFSVPDL
jgi:hypothetical protein